MHDVLLKLVWIAEGATRHSAESHPTPEDGQTFLILDKVEGGARPFTVVLNCCLDVKK